MGTSNVDGHIEQIVIIRVEGTYSGHCMPRRVLMAGSQNMQYVARTGDAEFKKIL